MIRSREEYLFVTIPNEIKINGEIMPLRANKYELRGEDPAFLMEAADERYVIWHGGSKTKSTMTREIRGDRLQAIARSIRADVTEGRYIKPWPAGPVYDVELDLATSLNPTFHVRNESPRFARAFVRFLELSNKGLHYTPADAVCAASELTFGGGCAGSVSPSWFKRILTSSFGST